jgi:hypothetical protein
MAGFAGQTNKAEAYFMHHFDTLNFNGLNLECKHAPELLKRLRV